MTRLTLLVPLLLSLAAHTAPAAEPPMVTPEDLLKNAPFKSTYLTALGPRAKERWLATLANSALVRQVSVAGTEYQVATPCKPHDCAENNLLLLYAPAKGTLYGRLHEKGKASFIGAPDAAMSQTLETLWKQEFRQQ